MTSRSTATVTTRPGQRSGELSAVYSEGITAGLLGAATVALWFLIVDTISGRPLFTPTVLGTALFRGGAGLDQPHVLPISFEMVFLFTWVHALVFAVIGGVAARLLAFAERTPNTAFGIILLFVIFQFGFVALTTTFAQEVLDTLAWPAVLVGNLLAAAAMGGYFWHRHRGMRVEP